MFDLKRILKALLFSSSEPLSIKDVQAVITRFHHQQEEERAELEAEDGAEAAAQEDGQGVMIDLLDQVPTLLTSTQVRDAMADIASDLEASQDVYRLQEGPHGYRLMVAPDLADWVRLLREEPRPKRLTPAQMETLAIVAYRQPVTRAEIEAVRGVSSDSALNRLIERELVVVLGRAELPGRPLQYGTTLQFLEFCGLRGVEELPASDVLSPQQLTEWIRQATQGEEPVGNREVGLAEAEIEGPEEEGRIAPETSAVADVEAAFSGSGHAAPDSEARAEKETGPVDESRVPTETSEASPADADTDLQKES